MLNVRLLLVVSYQLSFHYFVFFLIIFACFSILAINTVTALHGRYFSGRTVVGNYIPAQSYHKLFPASASATALLQTSFE